MSRPKPRVKGIIMHCDRNKLVRAVGDAPGKKQFVCLRMAGCASFYQQQSVQKGKML